MGRASQAKLMGNRKTTGDILCQPMTGFEKPRDGNRRAFMDIPDETIALLNREQLDNRSAPTNFSDLTFLGSCQR
ncbi:hypothetical protein B9Z55_008526 [Caenorhabditis nigoni]|uniref:Uncharacterized protein n=1 Tax=Caenorhabditis nigoni TaxID=1611254 RepID=A0A2G5UN63_9PELO|nr:hypothetical protein B9Z55_008526 [Caenorhabditis nigoni]